VIILNQISRPMFWVTLYTPCRKRQQNWRTKQTNAFCRLARRISI
jgi:hypothetical protein